MTRTGAKLAVPLTPEELEMLEILTDKKLMRSLWKAEEDERAHRVVEREKLFR